MWQTCISPATPFQHCHLASTTRVWQSAPSHILVFFFESCSTSFDSWHRNYFPIWHPPNLSPIWCKERRGGDVSCPLSLSPLMGYKAKSAVSPPTHQLHQSFGNLRGTFIMKLTSTCLSVTIKCHPVGKYFKYEVSPFVQCNEVWELFLFLFSCSCCEIRYL